jgi:hypothetical protein
LATDKDVTFTEPGDKRRRHVSFQLLTFSIRYLLQNDSGYQDPRRGVYSHRLYLYSIRTCSLSWCVNSQ